MRREFVGATLVVARVDVMHGVVLTNMGDHKGRPYELRIRICSTAPQANGIP